MSDATDADLRMLDLLRASRPRLEQELAKCIVGQREIIEQVLIALFAGGHCLITGAPGLAKTLLVKSVSQLFDLQFHRIQFTPDLMPADITGTEILEQDAEGRRHLVFARGPIFANVLLADEINRTPPKTQSALLEAMAEQQVTAAGKRYSLPHPFFVLATQNPVEMEGTYTLPEAQLDRFMFNVSMDYLAENDEVEVIRRTTAAPAEPIESLFSGADVLAIHRLVRQVAVTEDLLRYAVQLSSATRPSNPDSPAFVREWVEWGAGTRGAQHLILAAKARAVLYGRVHVSPEDVKVLTLPTLRHRVLLNYRALAARKTVDEVLEQVVAWKGSPR